MKIIIITILLSASIISCNEKDTEDKQYSSLLKNVDWKLIGFADAEKDELTVAQPESEKCYRLRFNDDNTFTGISSTNEIMGTYEIPADSSINIINLGGTKINELYDGKLYMECLGKVKIFSISEKRLALYYKDNKFLMFKPENEL